MSHRFVAEMASYTTLVHVHVETALKVASFVARLVPDGQAFEDKCKAAVAAQDTAGYLQTMMEQEGAIYGMENDKDIETLFQALFSVIYTLSDDTKNTASIIRSIATQTFANKDNKPNVRLSVGAVLFNLIFAGDSKCEVLNGLLEYALTTSQTNQVAHLFSRVDGWVKEWQLSAAAQRPLLKNFVAVLEAEGDKTLAVKAFIKYIQSFKSETGSYPAEVEARVTQAVLNAVNSPLDAFADRVALLEAINTQNLSAQLRPLVDLLRALCDGSLVDFQAFAKQPANVSACQQHKLDISALERSVRLLALCALAAQTTDKVLSFAAVQGALQVPAEEVELWVIEAIGERLLEASIDQISGTVTVNRYAHLSFGPAHWRNVQAKLRALRKQVAVAVEALQLQGKGTSAIMT